MYSAPTYGAWAAHRAEVVGSRQWAAYASPNRRDDVSVLFVSPMLPRTYLQSRLPWGNHPTGFNPLRPTAPLTRLGKGCRGRTRETLPDPRTEVKYPARSGFFVGKHSMPLDFDSAVLCN